MVTRIYDTDFSDNFFTRYTSSVNVTSITYQQGGSASTSGGETITLTGANFLTGAKVYINNQLVSVSSVISSSSISFTSPAKVAGTYILNVVNDDGGIGTLVPGIAYQ